MKPPKYEVLAKAFLQMVSNPTPTTGLVREFLKQVGVNDPRAQIPVILVVQLIIPKLAPAQIFSSPELKAAWISVINEVAGELEDEKDALIEELEKSGIQSFDLGPEDKAT